MDINDEINEIQNESRNNNQFEKDNDNDSQRMDQDIDMQSHDNGDEDVKEQYGDENGGDIMNIRQLYVNYEG